MIHLGLTTQKSIYLIPIKIRALLDSRTLRFCALLIFAHPYLTLNLQFFHSFVASFLLPIIFAHSYCASLLPSNFGQAWYAKIKGAQILIGRRLCEIFNLQNPRHLCSLCKSYMDNRWNKILLSLIWNVRWGNFLTFSGLKAHILDPNHRMDFNAYLDVFTLSHRGLDFYIKSVIFPSISTSTW